MGAIGGLLGLNGGAAGTGFQGPAQANIQPLTNQQQLDTSYSQNQNAMGQQQNLLQALQGQGGIANQASVYNQLQNVANGTGPNPAQAMLNQATGQNIAAQGALMAGQRGASANPGLIARQAALEGGNLQQQAVGQGATMQANQSLNALGQLGGIAGQQVQNQIGATNAYQQAVQGNQQALLNALASQNQAQVGSQSSVNSGNAGLANTMIGGQQKLIGGLGNAAGSIAGLANGGPVQSGPQSSLGQFLSGRSMNSGGSVGVKVNLSPQEKVVYPEDVQKAAGGNLEAKTVPGKAKVPGDSLKNDTFKTELPEGSIVIPRTKAKDEKSAIKFVQATLAKRGKK